MLYLWGIVVLFSCLALLILIIYDDIKAIPHRTLYALYVRRGLPYYHVYFVNPHFIPLFKKKIDSKIKVLGQKQCVVIVDDKIFVTTEALTVLFATEIYHSVPDRNIVIDYTLGTAKKVFAKLKALFITEILESLRKIRIQKYLPAKLYRVYIQIKADLPGKPQKKSTETGISAHTLCKIYNIHIGQVENILYGMEDKGYVKRDGFYYKPGEKIHEVLL